jgi:hypothetical protein
LLQGFSMAYLFPKSLSSVIISCCMCATLTFQYSTEHFNLGNTVRISMEMILNLLPCSRLCVVQQGFQERSYRSVCGLHTLAVPKYWHANFRYVRIACREIGPFSWNCRASLVIRASQLKNRLCLRNDSVVESVYEIALLT